MDAENTFLNGQYQNQIVAGKYQLQKLIGIGAHGEVFQAKVFQENRTVAVKIFYRHLQKEILRYILKELQVISSLSHPNILKVLAYGRGKCGEQMVHYLVTPWMEEGGLSEHLKKGRLPIFKSIYIALEVAEALKYMHENHFIHRDVKPQNILMNKAGEVVLGDFGIVCFADRTQTRAAGTIEYCAPEQMDDTHCKPDCRLDIYSLGMTLYEMLTGVNPYREIARSHGQAAAVRHKYVGEYPPVTYYNESLPYGLSLVVKKMIASNPEYRYSSINEVIQELQPYSDIENWNDFTRTEAPMLPPDLYKAFQEALRLSAEKKWDEALKKYDEILLQEPSCAQVYHERGGIFLQQKNYSLALENFDLAIRYRPRSYSSLCQRAHVRICLGDFSNALQDIEKAIELYSNRPEAYFYRSMLHRERSKLYLEQQKKDLYLQEIEEMKKFLAQYRLLKSSR